MPRSLTVPNETIDVGIDGAVATITLNRPDVINALSPQMRDELENALADLRPGDRVRVIRIRGAGRGFCSGYDLSSASSVYNAGLPDSAGLPDTAGPPGSAPLPGSDGPRAGAGEAGPAELGESSLVLDRERLRESIERWLRIWNYRKPIVAQVHGACLSGGLDLIGVCDLVYASGSARFGHPAARGLGIPPTMGMLPMKIGAARTKELFFTGDTIDGHEAFRLGLVNAVVPDTELDERCAALCRRISHTPLDALTLHKHVINRWSEIAGLRLGALEGADFDAMFHLTPASAEFGRIARRDGLRSALSWRDAAFDDS
jgi:enoyl-CoA hydratase